MQADEKTVADLVLRLTDSLIKLSTGLLIVPIAFLKFVSDMGPKAHPNALMGTHLIGVCLKLCIFIPLGASIGLGLIAHYCVVRAVCDGTLTQGTQLPRPISILICFSGLAFIVGTIALGFLFFQFPIEILEPAHLGNSRLG